MRLGDVHEPASPELSLVRRRWPGRLLAVLAIGLTAGALVRHGPGVMLLDEGEAAVIGNHLPALGGAPRVRAEAGPVFYFPIVQYAVRVPIGPTDVYVPGPLSPRSAEGIRLRVGALRAQIRVRPIDAPRALEAVGPEQGAQALAVEMEARGALQSVIGELTLGALAAEDAPQTVTERVRQGLATRLVGVGIELVSLGPIRWSLPEPFAGALDALAQVRAETERMQAAARRELARADESRARIDAEREPLHAALRAALREDEQAAVREGAEWVLDAKLTAIERGADATARAEELTRAAEAELGTLDRRAAALKARVDALADGGERVVEWEIATRVIPQLRGVRAGAAAEARPPAAAESHSRSPSGAPPLPIAGPRRSDSEHAVPPRPPRAQAPPASAVEDAQRSEPSSGADPREVAPAPGDGEPR